MNSSRILAALPTVLAAALLVYVVAGCTSDIITDAASKSDPIVVVTPDDESDNNQGDNPGRYVDSDASEFTVKSGRAAVNGQQIGSVGGLTQDPFSFFFVYAGLSNGGLFVVSDQAFDGAVVAGEFAGKVLNVTSARFHVVFESDVTMLSEETRPAWVLHDSTFVASGPHHGPESPFFGVSSELRFIFDL